MSYKTYHNPCGPWHYVPAFYKAWLRHPRKGQGHLKLLILQTLQERPLNGYEIIKSLEEKHGHAPGAAVIYPTLQLLQDQGCVDTHEQDKKQVYALTDGGRKYLQENSERIDRISESLLQPKWSSLPGIGKRIASLAGTIFSNCTYLDDAKTKQIEDLLDETRKRVGDIIFENQAD